MTNTNPSVSNGSELGEVLVPASNLRRWIVVGLLFVASFINYLDRATISVALPLLSTELHLGPEIKGIILSAFFWSYALMQVPAGWCADRWNLRWLYAGCFALWSLACGFTGFVGTLSVLIGVRVLLGIGESIYLPGGTKIVGLLFSSPERAFPSGLFDSGTRMGLAVGAPLIAALVAYSGWRHMFAWVGFSALLWIIPWLMAAPRNLKSVPIAPAGASSVAPKRFHFNRNLAGMCLGFFCFDYYWYLFVTWLPDYLVTVRHLTVVRAGIYSSLPYFVFGICQPLGGYITDALIRRGYNETRTRKTMLAIAFSCGVMLIPASRADSAQKALLFLVLGSFAGLASGNLFAVLQSCAPPDEVGLWTGFENFAGNIAGVLAPTVTGILIARTGSYLPAFVLAAVILAGGIIGYVFVVGDLPRRITQS